MDPPHRFWRFCSEDLLLGFGHGSAEGVDEGQVLFSSELQKTKQRFDTDSHLGPDRAKNRDH